MGTTLKITPGSRALPWLEWVEQKGGWRIRAGAWGGVVLDPDPRAIARRAAEIEGSPADRGPGQSWITGQLAVTENTVIRDDQKVFLTWVRADGKRLRKPLNALFQHVFGPEIPAYRVLTPRTPGNYDLVFEDERQYRLAAIPYRSAPRSGRPGKRAAVGSPRSPSTSSTWRTIPKDQPPISSRSRTRAGCTCRLWP